MMRQLRHDADLTVDDVAQRLLCSATKISRLETGQRNIALRDVRDLCTVYGVSDGERERLMTMARQSRERAWWQAHELDPEYSHYIGLEVAAGALRDFESAVIPGLLQTEQYARSLITGIEPSVPADVLDTRIATRLRRQQLLTRTDPPAPRLAVVVDESAFRRVVGGRAVMREQLAAVVKAAALPNVTLRIIPFDAGAHPGMDSTFTILEFAQALVPDVVYVETVVGSQCLERPAELDQFRHAFEELERRSLSPARSVAMIETIADGLRRVPAPRDPQAG
jgi:transcriptional regulator with XRE-family HTH domain